MSKQKTVKISLPEKAPDGFTGDWVDCDFTNFVNKAGGALAEALFRGDFRTQLFSVINIAHFRGKRNYHEQLYNETIKTSKVK